MNRAERRRVERKIQAIMRRDGDRCSLCHTAFPHNCKTFSGTTADDVVALVGECCAARLQQVVFCGVYTTHSYEGIPRGSAKPLSAEQITDAVGNLQKYFAAIDKVTDIARRAGISPPDTPSFVDSPWKADDRSWFEANPHRAHRLRPMFPGEASRFKLPDVPPDHEFQVLVRQVEPGSRARFAFCRNTKVEIPDIEPVIHALFDLANNNSRPAGSMLNTQEVAQLAQKYAAAAQQQQ